MAKIHELTAESTLTDSHLFITQENSDSSETKSATLALLKTWLNGLTFEDISQYFVEGTNVTINIDNETQKITITAATTGEKGDKGEDGVSPTAQIVQTDTGATITITDVNGTTTSNLINGKDGVTPHIDETTKHWFVGETDTGIIAEGQDGISPTITVEQTENGCTVTTVSGDTTTSAELKNGTTPHIDSETNHWVVDEVDTGINASGTGVIINDESIESTEATWSAFKINSEITDINNSLGDISTILSSVTGGIS